METTPPRNTLPDYFCGRLIFEEEDGDACRWVVFNGLEKHRFLSRKAAEKWCVKNIRKATTEDLDTLYLTHARLTSVYTQLDMIAPRLPEHTVILQQLAVNIRKIADNIDTIITQYQ